MCRKLHKSGCMNSEGKKKIGKRKNRLLILCALAIHQNDFIQYSEAKLVHLSQNVSHYERCTFTIKYAC